MVGRKLPAAKARSTVKLGMSFVEFVGCLVALGGGLVIGSMYLGIDVKETTVDLLEKADIEVPQFLRQSSPEAEAEDTDKVETEGAEATPTPKADEVEAEEQQFEVTVLPNLTAEEQQALIDAELALDEAEEAEETVPISDAERIVATQKFWKAFHEAVEDESEHRSKPIINPESWQLFDYLIHRKNGHQKVVDVINSLDRHGVDKRLRAVAIHMKTWHRAGANLFDRATHLLTDAPAGKLAGPFAQSWQSSATQHHMEEELLLNKYRAVAHYLEHTYRITTSSDSNQ